MSRPFSVARKYMNFECSTDGVGQKGNFSGGLAVICLQCRSGKRSNFDPWLEKVSWRRGQPTPIFLPGEAHGQRSLAGYSLQDHRESDTTPEVSQYTCDRETAIEKMTENFFVQRLWCICVCRACWWCLLNLYAFRMLMVTKPATVNLSLPLEILFSAVLSFKSTSCISYTWWLISLNICSTIIEKYFNSAQGQKLPPN